MTEKDVLASKVHRLELEMSEIQSCTGSDIEVNALRSAKHDLDRKVADMEDEIGDMQQEMHELEMVRVYMCIELIVRARFSF